MVKGTIFIIALVFLLTLLPLGTAAADNILAQVDVLLGVTMESHVELSGTVGSGAVATDSQGAAISVAQGNFDVAMYGDKAWVTLPIALQPGQSLASFSDSVSGLKLEGGKLTLSVKDRRGEEAMTITADVEEVRAEGVEVKVAATNVVLRSKELAVDLTTEDPGVGRVAVSFEVKLHSLSADAAMEVTVTKEPSTTASRAFVLTALDVDRAVADVACALNIEKTNLENQTNLGEAVITMKAGRAWADRFGLDRVSIIRYTEEGQTQILPTTFQGYEGDMAVFQANSPDGLSVFGLVSLVPLVAPTTNWVVVGGISTGGLLSLAFLLFFILWRRRRAQESALRERWPTGLRPDDWKSE